MNGRWLMRRGMNNDVGTSPDPKGACPIAPPSGDKLIADAMNHPGGQVRYPPQARTTAVSISAVQISRTGPDGLPALPSGLKLPPGQTLNLTHVDPEGRGRSIGQQLDDLLAVAERQALEEWKSDDS
jgi:hypothetical protein